MNQWCIYDFIYSALNNILIFNYIINSINNMLCFQYFIALRRNAYFIHTIMQKQIQLTENEAKLFTFLKSVASKYKPDLTLRVAGGWVRDKVYRLIRSLELNLKISTLH